MNSMYKKGTKEVLSKVLYVAICIFSFIYIFSVASFSERGFRKFNFLNYGIYLIYFSLIALFCSVFIYYFVKKISFKTNYYLYLIPIFVLFCFVGTLLCSKEFRGWITLVLLAVSFFTFYYAYRIIHDKTKITFIILAALFVFTIFYLIYYGKQILDFKGFFNGKNRLGSDFDNQNGVATTAAITFGLSLYCFVSTKSKKRFMFILPGLTSFWVGITTGSRTFIIVAYLLFAVCFSFFFSKHKIIYFSSLIFSTVVGLLLFNHYFDNRLLEAFKTLNGSAARADAATISRELYMDYGILLGARNAIFGLGVNGFGKLSGVGTYAHNNFAEVLCDFGIFGLVLFYLPILIFVLRCSSIKRVDKSFLITFSIYILVASFSNVLYYKKLYYVLLALMFYLSFEEPFILKRIPKINKIESVLFVCDSMQSGGAEKVIATLSNEMVKRSIKVTIIGVGDVNPPMSFYPLDNRVQYLNFSNNSKKKINGFKRIYLLRNKIKIIKPDIVISFLPNGNIYAWLSMLGLRIPHIVSERNNPMVDPKRKITRILKKMSFYFADGCVFQTNDARSYYKWIKNNRVSVIKNPIVLYSDKCDKSFVRKKTVLAVGRLTKQKNYKCLLDAFKIFSEKNNGYQLKIYGDGPLKSELIDYCKIQNIDENVFFMGNDSKWHETERFDSMYVLSSDYEGMPNSLAEAMALGVPAISTDCPIGGSKELITDGYNGFLVPLNNPEILAEKMGEIVKLAGSKFSEKNKNMVNDYSPKSIVDKWINFILSLEKEIYE